MTMVIDDDGAPTEPCPRRLRPTDELLLAGAVQVQKVLAEQTEAGLLGCVGGVWGCLVSQVGSGVDGGRREDGSGWAILNAF